MNAPAVQDQALKGQAWTAASRRLREEYPTQWQTFLREEYHQRNLTWNPKPTAEEKARTQLDAILTEFPHLAEEVVEEIKGEIGNEIANEV